MQLNYTWSFGKHIAFMSNDGKGGNNKGKIMLPLYITQILGGSGPLLCMAGMSPLFYLFHLHTYTHVFFNNLLYYALT
jgi:hypothetical protein